MQPNLCTIEQYCSGWRIQGFTEKGWWKGGMGGTTPHFFLLKINLSCKNPTDEMQFLHPGGKKFSFRPAT